MLSLRVGLATLRLICFATFSHILEHDMRYFNLDPDSTHLVAHLKYVSETFDVI